MVHEDHSPLPMRVLVESSAALMSALSVGASFSSLHIKSEVDKFCC